MAIECYEDSCGFHASHNVKDAEECEGPFCFESECRQPNGYYHLYCDAEGDKPCLVYAYVNPDTNTRGFGFNIADGGGFLPLSELSPDSVYVKVNISEPNKVNSDNYAELAVVTESPCTEEMKTRFRHCLPVIHGMLSDQIRLSNRMDELKKHLFYGKPYGSAFGSIANFDTEVLDRLTEDRILRLMHSAIGLSTETGEFMEALHDHIIDGKDLDVTNVNEELGDACWYIGIGCDETGFTLTECLQINNTKLAFRFPEKFTAYHAENRNLIGERIILEGAVTTNCVPEE